MEQKKNLVRSERLTNGLSVEFYDFSNRYFGDYHRVRIEVRCHIPLEQALFLTSPDPLTELQEARALLGNGVLFTHVLEKMGVPGGDLERVRKSLMDNYARNALEYLDHPGFAARVIAKELAQRRKIRRPFPRK
jgi:hypothetical protein